jgi:hypothetical protein
MQKKCVLSLRLVLTGLCLASFFAWPSTALGQAESAGSTTRCLGFAANAYGTTAFVGKIITSGKTAPVSIGSGCGTTKVGASQTGTVLSVSAAPTIATAAIDSTAASTANSATATSVLHQISLLEGAYYRERGESREHNYPHQHWSPRER